jgi:hypothetical protein
LQLANRHGRSDQANREPGVIVATLPDAAARCTRARVHPAKFLTMPSELRRLRAVVDHMASRVASDRYTGVAVASPLARCGV